MKMFIFSASSMECTHVHQQHYIRQEHQYISTSYGLSVLYVNYRRNQPLDFSDKRNKRLDLTNSKVISERLFDRRTSRCRKNGAILVGLWLCSANANARAVRCDVIGLDSGVH